MKTIDEYILEVSNKENISDGGSPAYRFDEDGVVLVKYYMPKKYGVSRDNEELIAEAANQKRAKGVRTPAHLAIKRELTETEDICWVLQECAKGKSYASYVEGNFDPETKLEIQQAFLNAPTNHYEKCIKDLSELFNMGLELKAKNIFYDSSKEDGGFTFIDLLKSDQTPADYNSLHDLIRLNRYVLIIFSSLMMSEYGYKDAPPEMLEQSKKLYYATAQKIFETMERIIPEFKNNRRWILRTLPREMLEYFNNTGFVVEDLALYGNEYQQFDEVIDSLLNLFIEKVASGQYKYWQIELNEVRNDLSEYGVKANWLFHKDNERDIYDFENNYDYVHTCDYDLEEKIMNLFNQKLEEIAKNTDNPNIFLAKEDMDKRLEEKLKYA